MTKAEREAKWEARFQEMLRQERQLWERGFLQIGGVDEVGRGPLAGPVVTACVVLPRDVSIRGIDDSKKLSEKRREALYDQILEVALAVGIGQEDNQVIDQINILEATKSAMGKAVQDAAAQLSRKGLNLDHLILDAIQLPACPWPQTSLVHGDSLSLSVAAASIIAKVTRDRRMVQYDAQYPGYGFANNKGYGTAAHYAGIRAQGITHIHRKTFLKGWV